MRAAIVCLATASCALAAKAPPRDLRFFAPPAPAARTFDGATCARVRLGRFTADADLRFALERRVSPVERAPSETLRWADPPEFYARRAIAAALFARPLEQAVSGPAFVLDVDVTAFEQDGGTGAVALHFELRDDRRTLARGDVRAVRPAAANPAALVTAIGAALDAASSELADRIVAAACPR
ncbi:MAG TPA: ABC-type transport auxiliary lipoprotein family protein [Kofleriaceae bacterium]